MALESEEDKIVGQCSTKAVSFFESVGCTVNQDQKNIQHPFEKELNK